MQAAGLRYTARSPSPSGTPAVINTKRGLYAMSTIQAEASKPQIKMQECNRCKAAGHPGQMISFEKAGEDPVTGKTKWNLIDAGGAEHTHKGAATFKKKRIVDIATVTDVAEARRLLVMGWEYKTSYPATIANIPHFVLVKRD